LPLNKSFSKVHCSRSLWLFIALREKEREMERGKRDRERKGERERREGGERERNYIDKFYIIPKIYAYRADVFPR